MFYILFKKKKFKNIMSQEIYNYHIYINILYFIKLLPYLICQNIIIFHFFLLNFEFFINLKGTMCLMLDFE